MATELGQKLSNDIPVPQSLLMTFGGLIRV